ncbi:MAG: cysteine hydrolase [Methanomassiliicoccaceae archaeon]|nr:cysteine hydrolase [Methanomassiliicoccaceae archaeon]
MKKLLIVVDMQNDFINGSLGTPQAQRIVPRVKTKIAEYKKNGNKVVFTRDTHHDDYLEKQEGKCLPVVHCVEGTHGHEITNKLDTDGCTVIDKPTFGSPKLAVTIGAEGLDEIELCGLCTDICVISNALIIKANNPETKITVDAGCCAGTTEEGHKAALLIMKTCHVNVIGEERKVL